MRDGMRGLIGARRAVAVLVASLTVASSARPAAACHEVPETQYLLSWAGGVLAIDVPLAIHDIAVGRSSKPYAVAELALTAAMIGHGVYGLNGEISCWEGGVYPMVDPGLRSLVTLSMVWKGVLLGHAIFVLARKGPPRAHATVPSPSMSSAPTAFSWTLTPTVVTDGARAQAGLGLVATF